MITNTTTVNFIIIDVFTTKYFIYEFKKICFLDLKSNLKDFDTMGNFELSQLQHLILA